MESLDMMIQHTLYLDNAKYPANFHYPPLMHILHATDMNKTNGGTKVWN